MSDILLPPLSVLLPLNANLDLKFAVLQAGASYYDLLPGGYRTIEQAQADGAVVMAYGVFLNKTLNFVGLGSALYALAGLYQYLSKDPIIKHMVKCRYCRKRINEKVSGGVLLLCFLIHFCCFLVCPTASKPCCPLTPMINSPCAASTVLVGWMGERKTCDSDKISAGECPSPLRGRVIERALTTVFNTPASILFSRQHGGRRASS